jgi:hypothetical protein
MTPQEALDQAIVEAQKRFIYIPDAPTEDVWDTVREMEQRGGGDCDGWVLWCLARAADLCPAPGAYHFVEGTILRDGQTLGHAWAEVRVGADLQWADPTWGIDCERLAYYSDRTPWKSYPVDGEIMGQPEEYERESGSQ